MTRRRVSEQEIDEALEALPGWSIKDGKLHKVYEFDSFAKALGWMVIVGVQADKMNHHPDWSNVYNKVTVNLSTHDMDNAISTWDLELAEKMEAAAGNNGG